YVKRVEIQKTVLGEPNALKNELVVTTRGTAFCVSIEFRTRSQCQRIGAVSGKLHCGCRARDRARIEDLARALDADAQRTGGLDCRSGGISYVKRERVNTKVPAFDECSWTVHQRHFAVRSIDGGASEGLDGAVVRARGAPHRDVTGG